MPKVTFDAEPAPLSVDTDRAALVIIDMQRDFLEPGGFGEALGNDVSKLQAAVAPLREVLAAARDHDMLVIHTREGHRPDLSDAPPHKVERGDPSTRIAGIDTLFVCGVTTEVCVNTTVREANDRGFRCIVLSDCCGSYFPEFHAAGLAMIKAQGGIFGSVAASTPLLNSLASIGYPVRAAV
jgi:biuret amidohydrolase